MRRRIGLSVSLCVLFLCSSLQAQDDIVMKAMRDELTRSLEKLQLEELDKPYFIAYRVEERTNTRVSASFGSLISSSENRTRYLTVEVRVGDHTLDNTNFLSFYSFRRSGVVRMLGGTVPLPLDDDYKELRRQIWLATDGAYKKALEDLAKKRAVLQNKTRTEEVPDFSQEEPTTVVERAMPAKVDLAEAETLVRDLSTLFKEMPEVFASEVHFAVSNIHTRYVNSEETSFTRISPSVRFVAFAQTQASDGMSLEDFVAVYGRSVDALPPRKELAAHLREMGARLAELRAAPLIDRYNGPVLVEGQAAAELFNQVFAPMLLGTRRAVSDNPRFERLSSQGQNPFLDRIGARVLPKFLSVVDDPTLEEHNKVQLVGGYKVDDDGVRARQTKLVEKGFLNTLLVTRNPVRGITQSTGNRRGSGPLPSNVFVIPEGGLSSSELREEFLRLVKQRGKEYGIVVRRIGNPLLKLSPDRMASMLVSLGRGGARVQSGILAYRVYLDGREELIRNSELADITPATFKDIVAASTAQAVYSVPFAARRASPFSSFSLGRGAPIVSFVMPSLLFEDLTVKKPTGEIPNPPVAKHPFFDK